MSYALDNIFENVIIVWKLLGDIVHYSVGGIGVGNARHNYFEKVVATGVVDDNFFPPFDNRNYFTINILPYDFQLVKPQKVVICA